MKLSKSKFMAGVQCLKRLYLLANKPQLAGEPNPADRAILEQGLEVGRLARQLFPGGVEVNGCGTIADSIRTTRALLANPEIPAIFEGTFEHGDVLVRVDVLQRRRKKRWRLLEVKSTTRLKDHHLYEVGIQRLVVSRCGLDLGSCGLMHINREYVYAGGPLDVRQLFRIRDLTRQTQKLTRKLNSQLRREFQTIHQRSAPDIAPGRHCTEPVLCEFFDQCNPERPGDHILNLPRIHAKVMEELQKLAVESVCDIPADFPLNERLRQICTCIQTGEPWYSAELADQLRGLEYPLYFMDFETVNPAIPRFARMRPYDQIPFQWSVHVQNRLGAEPEHHEFLAINKDDSRREFAATLCAAVGKHGSVVVYHQQFESQRLAELGACLPEFEDQIKAIQSRLFDLLPVIRNCVYHPGFAGSYSLKAVLPALVPELSYDSMVVANGQAAS